jgi:integrase
MHPESINKRVQAAAERAGLTDGPYSAHSLHAGFVTYAHLCGASDHAIAHQARHRSLASVSTYGKATRTGLAATRSCCSTPRAEQVEWCIRCNLS